MITWTPPSEHVALKPNEVHVWRVDLDVSVIKRARDEACLADDERERAASYLTEEQRSRFVAARGAVRRLLSRYTGASPSELRFAYGQYGKPFLVSPGNTDWHFNLSHSADVALVAVAWGAPLGVDAQKVKCAWRYEPLLPKVLAPSEVSLWNLVAPAQRRETFLRLWTAKEAYAKADGRGVKLPFVQMDASSLLSHSHDAWHGVNMTQIGAKFLCEGAQRKLKILESGSSHSFALVVNESIENVRCWSYE